MIQISLSTIRVVEFLVLVVEPWVELGSLKDKWCSKLVYRRLAHNPSLSELCQPPGGLSRIHRGRENSAMDVIEEVDDAVKVAVLDV